MDARVRLDGPTLVARPVKQETPPEAPLAMPQQPVELVHATHDDARLVAALDQRLEPDHLALVDGRAGVVADADLDGAGELDVGVLAAFVAEDDRRHVGLEHVPLDHERQQVGLDLLVLLTLDLDAVVRCCG